MFYRSGAVHRFIGILNFDVVGHTLRHPDRVEGDETLSDVAAFAERVAKIIVEEVPPEIVNLDNIFRTR